MQKKSNNREPHGFSRGSFRGDPIILIDPTTMAVPLVIEAYLKKLYDANIHPNIVSFDGTVVAWTPDPVANIKAICDELGLNNGGNTATFYSIAGNSNIHILSVVSMPTGTGMDGYIVFKAWNSGNQQQQEQGYGKIKPIAKELFKFYSPTGYSQIYNMVDASWSGSYSYTAKTYSFDNREYGIRIDDESNTLTLYISKPGQKLPPLKGVNM
ncbi:N-acetylmuramoyl-L-alanine amidase [Desulfosporosinus metallidurans]|uniref:N-acetylmuramoyl-L-alanine amidase n=1 Tax=Desulfosporosinus metallidurans TaxID=1888891 RepID=A0A1Q8QG02_9FIRM|nr:N-acetylmuramoyl-L-alanine amidase [Desulfosporosinus metallidurans]